VADGIHATMEAVEAARLKAPMDLASREPQRQELPRCHDAVLSVGHLGDLTVTWTILTTYTVASIVHVSHPAHRANNFVTRG
jgi:hypothetical protein